MNIKSQGISRHTILKRNFLSIYLNKPANASWSATYKKEIPVKLQKSYFFANPAVNTKIIYTFEK